MTYKLGQAIGDVLTGQAKYAPSEVQNKRLSICQTCPEHKPVMKVCGNCGCYLPAKVKFELSSCPIGKW